MVGGTSCRLLHLHISEANYISETWTIQIKFVLIRSNLTSCTRGVRDACRTLPHLSTNGSISFHHLISSPRLSSSRLTSFISVSPWRSPSARPRQLVARRRVCTHVVLWAQREHTMAICLAKSNNKAKVSKVFCIGASGGWDSMELSRYPSCCCLFRGNNGDFSLYLFDQIIRVNLTYLIRLYLVNLTIPMIFLLPSVSCETTCIVDEFIYF